jgi:hypothetical protein
MSHHSLTRDRRHESGSAYIIALLVLVVLTILGLSLTVISQTEVQIGANEVMTHRSLYGAEGGLNLALARVLTVNSSVSNATVPAVVPMAFTIPEQRLGVTDDGVMQAINPVVSGVRFAERVTVSPFVPIRDSFCDMCPAGEGDVQLVNVNHAVVATAQRVSWSGADEDPFDGQDDPPVATHAQKQLYVMIGLQPWHPPRWESIADEEQTQEIVQKTMGRFDDMH